MTVRTRLTLWYSSLLVAIVLAFAVASYVYVERLEYARIDRMLHEQSEIVEQAIGSIEAARGTFDAAGASSLLETLHDLRARGIRAWVLDDAGALRISTAAVNEGEGPDEERAVLGDTVSLESVREFARRRGGGVATIHSGAHGARLLAARIPRKLGAGTLLLSYPLDDVAVLLERARFDAAVAILLAFVVSLLAGVVLAGRAMRPIDDALDQQRRFMADASHELRTPVAVMRGEADVALRSSARTANEYREALAVVQTAAERLGHTVDDIFMLALVDAKQAPTVPAALYLNDLLIDGCRAMRSIAEARGISIDCTASTEAAYVGDEQLLRRLIANLLDNAIKYSAPHQIVIVRFDRTDDAYVVSVSNGGPGIPADAREHVFDRFFRADTARTAAIGEDGRVAGSGLGLPIARWIAEQHGGTVELSEATADRTTFTVRLPLRPALTRAR